MPAPSYLDALAEELGAVAGRIEREAKLRIDAAVADLGRRDAERELRVERLEKELRDRLATIKDGERGEQGEPGPAGQSVTAEDVAPDDVAEMVARAIETVRESKPAPRSDVVLNINPEGKPKKKTITTRRDADGNLVADVVEQA